MSDEHVEGRFIARENRFVAVVEVDGIVGKAHVPNSGRMKELLVTGAPVSLVIKSQEGRKTKYKLASVKYKGIWVSIDSSIPNKLLEQSFLRRELFHFSQYRYIKSEVKKENSRFDFLLKSNENEKLMYVEAKSVTLVENKRALFPDAPTTRGKKHLDELKQIAIEGGEAAVVFIVQRSDAESFAPNWTMDTQFSQALVAAFNSGVKVYAYQCETSFKDIYIKKEIPVLI
ncbi:sugar fermentation stimulation protein A [Desulfitispora alkaliphila]|uniref:DNA/RNA nuclease SfsA n=1 Tax=Desulfitispora alkaliphila TaxID=622674 RepID=UPI003D2282DD